MNITSEVVLVTPEQATEWLEKNNSTNRRIRSDAIRRYANIMRSGKWRLADSITFDYNGQLVNGQHRLHGVVEYGEPVAFIILRGVEPEAMDTYDQGLTRQANDVLTARGLPTGNSLASGTAWWMLLQLGESPVNARSRSLITNTDIADYIEANLDDARFAHHIENQAHTWSIPTAFVVAAYAMRSAGVPDVAFEDFVESLRYGDGLERDDPRLLLRNRIISRPIGRERNPRQGPDMMATILDVWNMHVLGKRRRTLNWTPCTIDYVMPEIIVPGQALSAAS